MSAPKVLGYDVVIKGSRRLVYQHVELTPEMLAASTVTNDTWLVRLDPPAKKAP